MTQQTTSSSLGACALGRASKDEPQATVADPSRRRASARLLRMTGKQSVPVNDYSDLRDYLKRQKLPGFVLSFDASEKIIDAAFPRAAHRASWWETLRSPQEKMPQREACLEGGYIATRLADGKSVRFKRVK